MVFFIEMTARGAFRVNVIAVALFALAITFSGRDAAADWRFQPADSVLQDNGPFYPHQYLGSGRVGRVYVKCVIQTTGLPTECKVLSIKGGSAFGIEALRWLNGPHVRHYRPIIRDGRARPTEEKWVVTIPPPD